MSGPIPSLQHNLQGFLPLFSVLNDLEFSSSCTSPTAVPLFHQQGFYTCCHIGLPLCYNVFGFILQTGYRSLPYNETECYDNFGFSHFPTKLLSFCPLASLSTTFLLSHPWTPAGLELLSRLSWATTQPCLAIRCQMRSSCVDLGSRTKPEHTVRVRIMLNPRKVIVNTTGSSEDQHELLIY